MDETRILSAFREELIAANLVRRPTEATPAGKPPCHVEPIEGPPAPGEREGIEDDPNLVLSLLISGPLTEETNYDAATRRRVVVDLRRRARDNTAYRSGLALDAAIRGRLIRPETSYGYGFILGTDAALYVHQAGIWGGGPISRSKAGGFDDVAKYLFEVPGV